MVSWSSLTRTLTLTLTLTLRLSLSLSLSLSLTLTLTLSLALTLTLTLTLSLARVTLTGTVARGPIKEGLAWEAWEGLAREGRAPTLRLRRSCRPAWLGLGLG